MKATLSTFNNCIIETIDGWNISEQAHGRFSKNKNLISKTVNCDFYDLHKFRLHGIKDVTLVLMKTLSVYYFGALL